MRCQTLEAVVLSLLLQLNAQAQQWVQCQPPTKPPKRDRGPAMAYDSSRQRAVLFGGNYSYASNPTYNDTREWDGWTWIQCNPRSSPSARVFHSMAYDAGRQRVVLFGGFNWTTWFQDTWEWDGQDWKNCTPAVSPPAGSFPMVYDSARREVMLSATETWTWNGVTWTKKAVSVTPGGGWSDRMAYDSARQVVVFFSYGRETWEWDGGKWTHCLPGISPPSHYHPGMVYDPMWRRVVLFGGDSTGGADVWEWDGETWVARKPPLSPLRRGGLAMVYDAARRRTMFFGGDGNQGTGQDETWEYNPCPAVASTVGEGCPGSNTKTPTHGALTLPILGRKLVLDLSDALPRTPTVLVFGASNPNIDLGRFGAPGCRLHADPALTMTLMSNAEGTWSQLPWIPVPDDGRLLGLRFYSQVVVTDPKANSLGLITTNGLCHEVGL